jgi:cyclopropane-fatty-acyl-phospholipid synthase
MTFHDRGALYSTFMRPELNWGDLYSQGRVEVDGDLVALLDTVYRGIKNHTDRHWLDLLKNSPARRKIGNSLRRAADNIHHHYDIGNDFYRLWLDREAMQYTCAYYPDPAMSLEQAQLAKMAHVCRKLQLRPGDEVVEAGCGWGGFALYMARHHGVRVRAYNISREQVTYARDRARAENLDDRVEYVLDDYRNINGQYDVFVSVGMLEHVGPGDYPVLGRVIDNCLKPAGRGLIHSIGRNRPRPINAWIERRIFPGAYPPTLREMTAIFEGRRFSVLDVENLRLHYALTLAEWRSRFEQNAQRIAGMMDERFVRAWRLYLSGSQAAFTAGQLQLFQVVFARELHNEIPWSRAHQYEVHASPGGRVAGDD